MLTPYKSMTRHGLRRSAKKGLTSMGPVTDAIGGVSEWVAFEVELRRLPKCYPACSKLWPCARSSDFCLGSFR